MFQRLSAKCLRLLFSQLSRDPIATLVKYFQAYENPTQVSCLHFLNKQQRYNQHKNPPVDLQFTLILGRFRLAGKVLIF